MNRVTAAVTCAKQEWRVEHNPETESVRHDAGGPPPYAYIIPHTFFISFIIFIFFISPDASVSGIKFGC
jgi:hypothetical protein